MQRRNTREWKSLHITAFAALFVWQGVVSGQSVPLYQNVHAPLEARVNDLFRRLTRDEKLKLLGGTGFTTQPIPRLGVPAMAMADAGQGVRGGQESTKGPATAFPSGVLMASTWDTNLLWRIGQAIGVEARNKGTGVQVLLGPAVNIQRSPLGGRNGEFFTEDPYLDARLTVPYILGVQSTGVGACVKHFVCYNQETDRGKVNVAVSPRALYEIYLPAFKAAVQEGHVWAVMSSYNKINGSHASANHYLLTDVLKKGWGFSGLVMSDWGGVHETAAVQAGNDLEMPTGKYMSVPKLKQALTNGTVTWAAVNDSVRRILRTIIRVGLLDGPLQQDHQLVNSPAHRKLAYEVATQGIVLLKNQDALLPLDPHRIKSIAVIGYAAKHLQVGALGSPRVVPLRKVEPLAGIRKEAGTGIKVRYALGGPDGDTVPASVVTIPGQKAVHGFRAEYFKNMSLKGQPALVRVDPKIQLLDDVLAPAPGIPRNHFSVRWSGELKAPATGTYTLAFRGDDGFRVFLDNHLVIDRWHTGGAATLSKQVYMEAGKTYNLRVEFFQNGGSYIAWLTWRLPSAAPFAKAVQAAKDSDVAVVCVSTEGTEGEGQDRSSMALPGDQAALIRAVAAVNPRTIVVLNNGTPVLMNWLNNVPAVLESWFPGEEGGAAIAAILFGKVDPSGKLPTTLAARRQDYPDYGNYPGKNNQVDYQEGIYVGYRWFEKKGIQPLFPFGYGLSYTTFKFSHLRLSSSKLTPDGTVMASVDITNTGKRSGKEVAQLYVHDVDPKIDVPVRELKGFVKVALQPGQTKTARFALTPHDLAYFNASRMQWQADAGRYEIEVGASSRGIRQTAELRLDSTFVKRVAEGHFQKQPINDSP